MQIRHGREAVPGPVNDDPIALRGDPQRGAGRVDG
jgi:hypothetical protein